MPPFRFNIPFFSYGTPSRPSSGTSSPSPPPTPPTSSRPPFRPGGIAQPSKPATSLETKPKVSPSLSRSKSNAAATAASSSASQLPSRGAATPSRLAKQSNHSDPPVKKPESLKAEEQKVAMKDKPSREVKKEASENSNTVVAKPPAARSEQKEAEEAQKQRKQREVEKLAVVEMNSKTAQEQQKSKGTEKLAVEEKKKGLQKDMEEKTKTAQEQQTSKETEKLALEENKKVLGKDIEEKTKRAQETEKLAVEEKKKSLSKDMEESEKRAQEQQRRKETETLASEEKKKSLTKDMEESSKTAPEQQRRKETEKLAAEEKKKVLRKDIEENSKTAQEQQKIKETEKLAAEEIHTAPKTVGREDTPQSKTAQHITATSESSRGSKDLPVRKPQNRTENHTDDNHQKAKEGSSSMSKKIKEDIRDGLSKLTWGKSNGDNEKSVSVYTLIGENRGATMAIGSEKDKKDGEVHIRRGYKSNPDDSPDTTATETEGGTRIKPYPKDKEEDARVRAYVNGNSQGVNNSIICDSSVQQNDPGIHVSLKFEKVKKKDETTGSPPENVAEKKPAEEKMKYEPRVRRRCLRGLLAESSESDPGNPSKPRRHGCRFTCKDKDIENT